MPNRSIIVRQNVRSNADLEWARSATKHRISRERSRYVIEHCGLRFEQPPSLERAAEDVRLVFLGNDADEIALEVMAIELEDGGLFVIHAMPLRDRFRDEYEEARQWLR